MSVMLFREANEVKWVGVRPAHKGTQVTKETLANNATVILHTVTSGKTLFLNLLAGSVRWEGSGRGRIGVRDGSDVVQYYIFEALKGSAQDTIPFIIPFNIPLEIPAGWDVFLDTNSVSVYIYCFLHGWEE